MRIRVLAGAYAALALIFGASAAQAAPQVQTLVNMSNDGPASNGDNEVDIAINPTDGSPAPKSYVGLPPSGVMPRSQSVCQFLPPSVL